MTPRPESYRIMRVWHHPTTHGATHHARSRAKSVAPRHPGICDGSRAMCASCSRDVRLRVVCLSSVSPMRGVAPLDGTVLNAACASCSRCAIACVSPMCEARRTRTPLDELSMLMLIIFQAKSVGYQHGRSDGGRVRQAKRCVLFG